MATVRPQRGGRAPQQRRVARLQADPGGVAGDVGPVLVDDRHDAERHPHPLDLQSVGALPAVEHLADRVGKRGHLAQAVGHARDPGVGEPRRSSGPGSMPSASASARSAALAARISARGRGAGRPRRAARRSCRRSKPPAGAQRPRRPAARGRGLRRPRHRRVTAGRLAHSRPRRTLQSQSGATIRGTSGAVRPCRHRPRCLMAQRPGRPGLTSSRSSPAVEALEKALPPPVGDELAEECDGSRAAAQERRGPERRSVGARHANGRKGPATPVRAAPRGRRGGRPRADRPSASSAVRRPATDRSPAAE